MEDEKRLKELTTEQTEFKREIGVFGGVSIIGGIMIGSGIFYLGSYVLQRTGMNSGLALICWVIAGIISLFGGLCYAELGTAMPKAGGRVVYLNEAFHPVVGFTAGFTDWLVGGPGSIAAVAIALMEVLRSFFDISGFGIKMGAIVLIVALTAYNLVGVKIASIVQSLSMIAKLVPVGIVMLVALFVGRVSPDLSLGAASDYAAANDTSILSMIAIAVVASLWAYEGWTNLNTVAEEIKNPKRNLPLALIIGIGGVTVLYTLFNFAIMKVLPHEQIVAMINAEDLYLGTAVAEKVLGSAGAIVVSIGMILAMFGTANGMVLAQPRMYYAMAEEGHFFKSFAKLHPKYKVPYAPIIVQGVLSIALVLMRNLDQLTNLVVVVAMIYNALVILAVPILRKKYPNIERPYKVWFYPVSVIITALIFIGLIVISAIEDPVNGAMGLSVPVIGAGVYYIFDMKLKREKK
ncbi:APC family permease [Emergencia sp.]|uniref:APC family permease n=1 Tax=Emergencia sp. TaxID=1926557 RepID=UPI003AF0A43E